MDNQILSEKRAKVVFEYLSNKVESTLSYRGFGEMKPLVPNERANGRMINRRTSFVIIQ
jgi:outer membrane protein OmpA-like peptidoglycan-associated protein